MDMWRSLWIAFLIAHGLTHLAIWATPKPKSDTAPFDPGQSWLLGERRRSAVGIAAVAAVVLVSAGLGLWTHADWWRMTAVIGAAVSLVLVVLYFNRWLILAVVLDVGMIVGVIALDWPSKSTVGA
jgi:hypothetical protein